MRIRIIHKPTAATVDGLDLHHYEAGFQYEVGTTLANLMLAHGWAEPVVDGKPALVVPLDEFAPDAKRHTPTSPNLQREYRSSPRDRAIAADRSSRTRKRHSDSTESDPQ